MAEQVGYKNLPESIKRCIKEDLVFTNSAISQETIREMSSDELDTIYNGLYLIIHYINREKSQKALLYRKVVTMSEAEAKNVNKILNVYK